MNLQDLRKELDKIDDQMAALFEKRMGFCKEVAFEKARSNDSCEKSQREKEIINRVTEKMPAELKLFTKQLFMTVMDTSKAYQMKFIGIKSPTADKIRSAISDVKPFPVSATVACQGVVGSYASLAAEKAFAISDISYVKTFENVFEAVEKGLCEYGVLPVENSTAGSVNAVYDLMRKHNFYIVRSVKLRVQHSLLGLGHKLSDVKEVFSHPQAIEQCRGYLNKLGVKVTATENTALSAKEVAESKRTDIACIASPNCSKLYGLNAIASNIQDSDNNYTRFIVISKDLRVFEDSDKISLMVNLPHEAGSLNKLLNKFSMLNLNLTKLESRPLKDTSFEFLFYFDFDAKVEKPEVQSLLAETENMANMFVFLGSYKEV